MVGIDGTDLARYSSPSLTTLEADKKLGRKAFELLYANMIQGNVGYFRNGGKLLVRESTAARS